MSYDVVYSRKAPCACGKGAVSLVVSENDWNQTRESVTIECEACKKLYRIESKFFCPKPKHEYTVYYMVANSNPEDKIKLDL